jgi:hypothetical protein
VNIANNNPISFSIMEDSYLKHIKEYIKATNPKTTHSRIKIRIKYTTHLFSFISEGSITIGSVIIYHYK